MRVRLEKPILLTVAVGVSLLAVACGAAPRVTNFDAARVAVEVTETTAEGGSAGTYAIALLEFGDLRSRYLESQASDVVLELTAVNGTPLLEQDALVWASVVTLDEMQSSQADRLTDSPQRRLVLVDTSSGLPLFSAALGSNLALPGGLHTVSELERAP